MAEKWSERSQASLIAEHRLRSEQENLRMRLAHAAHAITALEKECADLAGVCARQGPILRGRLSDKLHDLEVEKRLNAAYQARMDEAAAELKKLTDPSEEERQARREVQTKLASKARERFSIDQRISEAVETVRQLLTERGEISGEMCELARAIDLKISGDSFDLGRFRELSSSLPRRVVNAESERWLKWFLGESTRTTGRRVDEETRVLPESLATANFYKRGDTVPLEAEEEKPLPVTAQTAEQPASALAESEPLNEVDRWYTEQSTQ